MSITVSDFPAMETRADIMAWNVFQYSLHPLRSGWLSALKGWQGLHVLHSKIKVK